jgi:Leucine-rich repeat (LRR) protein/fibronectin type 3 domain-containing protein
MEKHDSRIVERRRAWPRVLLAALVAALAACSGGGGSGTSAAPATGYVPQGFVAIAGDQRVFMHWPRIPSATSYNLYWSTASGITTANATKIGLTDAEYQHTGLTNGTAYYYAYTVVTPSGESELSTEVVLTPGAQSAARPEPVDAHSGDGRVEVRWNGVANATAYQVYWKPASGVTTSDTKIADATSPAVVTGLTNGQAYYFVATAQTSGGESAVSTEIVAVPFLSEPLRPATVSVTSGGGQATVAWDAVPGATSYDVYWSDATGVSTASQKFSAAGTSYTHTGLINGTRYYYAVAATNARGSSDLSREVATTPAASVATIPSGVTARSGSEKVTVSWSSVANATEYALRWYTSGGATQTISNVTSPYEHTGRTPGAMVFYGVVAVVGGTAGAPSAEVAATPNDVAPESPLRLVVRAGREQAAIETDEADDALRYNIYWNTSGNVSTSDNVIANVTLPFTHTGLTNGMEYHYRIAALNGEGQSALSSANHAVPDATRLSDVVWSNAKLQACVNSVAAAVGWSYLHQVIFVQCDSQSGLDLGGLSQFKNLISLFAENNTNVTSLGELDTLLNLSVLGMEGSGVANLDYLSGHYNLFAFRANGNALTDLSALSAFKALNTLYLTDNAFTDLAPLAGLTNLQYLWLGHAASAPGRITDLSPLAGLNALRDLRVENNRVANLSPLASLTSLNVLWLDHDSADSNTITDLGPLQNLTALTDLRLANNGISMLNPLSGLTQLETLVLFNNDVTGLDSLTTLTKLRSLDVGANGVQQVHLPSLAGLTNLTRLVISANSISSLTPISGLTDLTELYAASNQIVDASPAAALTNLVTLDLANNTLGGATNGKVDTLETLTKATFIGLSGNVQISCAAVEYLRDKLGASVVDLDGDENTSDVPQPTVNCTN